MGQRGQITIPAPNLFSIGYFSRCFQYTPLDAYRTVLSSDILSPMVVWAGDD